MSNTYGFDFLRNEHNSGGTDTITITGNSNEVEVEIEDSTTEVPDVSHKSDLEKQFDVIRFLQEHRGSGCLPPSVIYNKLGIIIDGEVEQMLMRNPKIRVEEIPDPENPSLTILTFGYQAKFQTIQNKVGLKAQINRCIHGVKRSDLLDAYSSVEEDLKSLITAGDVLAVANNEDKDLILFPRGESFLVELDGACSATGEQLDRLHMDVDPTKQLRRGEAVWVANQWFRVSSAVKEGVSLEQQPPRAQAPPSVTLLKNLSRKNDVDGYIKPFTSNSLPLDHTLDHPHLLTQAKQARDALQKLLFLTRQQSSTHTSPDALASALVSVMSRKNPHKKQSVQQWKQQAKRVATNPNLLYSHARRHGCTMDVRHLYLKTAADIPTNDDALQQLMIQHSLISPDEQFRRPRFKLQKSNLDNDGKPKKRRYYEKKGQRITNTHLIGTAIGAALARAAEKQQQGKAVGDGGM